jgi:hypothetical protein
MLGEENGSYSCKSVNISSPSDAETVNCWIRFAAGMHFVEKL